MTEALTIERLTVAYGPRCAVDDLSLSAPAGAVTALLGPNGAGKTSTVEAVVGLRRPSAGAIRVLGRAPDDPHVRPRLGVMLQDGGPYPSARPLAWLTYLAGLYPRTEDPAAVLEGVGIDPASRTPIRRLSGGEQQRVKLAAALLPDPALLILDEPTAGMDAAMRRTVLADLRRRRDAGTAILLTTHLLADVEALADRITVIARGRVVAAGTLDELTGGRDAVSFSASPGLAVDALATHLGHAVSATPDGRYVVDAAPTPSLIAAITGWCAARDILVTDVHSGRRSLEDLLIDLGEGT